MVALFLVVSWKGMRLLLMFGDVWKGIRKHGDGLRLHLPGRNHWVPNTSCFKLHRGRSPRISIVAWNFGRSTFQVRTLVYPPVHARMPNEG